MSNESVVLINATINLQTGERVVDFTDHARNIINMYSDSDRIQYINDLCDSYPRLKYARFCCGPYYAKSLFLSLGKMPKRMLQSRLSYFRETLLSYSEEIVLLRRCYFACRNVSDSGSQTLQKIKLVHLITKTAQTIPQLVKKRISYVQNADYYDLFFKFMMSPYKSLYNSPYADFYNCFPEQNFQNRYGRSISTRLNDMNDVHYWFFDNPESEAEVEETISKMAKETADLVVQSQMDISTSVYEVATSILQILDDLTMKMASPIITRLDSGKRFVSWEANTVDQALYLYMISETLTRQDVKECRICGNLFIASRDTKLYCHNHTRSQINYYNRLIKGKYDKEPDSKDYK